MEGATPDLPTGQRPAAGNIGVRRSSWLAALRAVAGAAEDGVGFAAITGPPGTGKTTLLRRAAKLLDQPPVQVIFVKADGGPLTLRRLLPQIAGAPADAEAEPEIERAHRRLLTPGAPFTRTILMVDDAHELRHDALAYLQLASRPWTDAGPRLQIMFAGSPAFWDKLDGAELRPLLDRIRFRAELAVFDVAEDTAGVPSIPAQGATGSELVAVAGRKPTTKFIALSRIGGRNGLSSGLTATAMMVALGLSAPHSAGVEVPPAIGAGLPRLVAARTPEPDREAETTGHSLTAEAGGGTTRADAPGPNDAGPGATAPASTVPATQPGPDAEAAGTAMREQTPASDDAAPSSAGSPDASVVADPAQPATTEIDPAPTPAGPGAEVRPASAEPSVSGAPPAEPATAEPTAGTIPASAEPVASAVPPAEQEPAPSPVPAPAPIEPRPGTPSPTDLAPVAQTSPKNAPARDAVPVLVEDAPTPSVPSPARAPAISRPAPVAAAPAVAAAPVAAVTRLPPEPAPSPPAWVALMVRRGDEMLRIGDVEAARLLYARAAEAGDSAAALAVGRTHDPRFLRQIGAQGITADPAQAAGWYRRAAALGSRDAERLLAGLAANSSPDTFHRDTAP